LKPNIKKINVPVNNIANLRRNEVFGAVGNHRLLITCDMGAVVTVVPVECVELHQLTGEMCELAAFNQTKSEGQWCNVKIVLDKTVFHKKTVTQLGATLG